MCQSHASLRKISSLYSILFLLSLISYFTGVASAAIQKYSGNPIISSNLMRDVVKVNNTYYEYEEVGTIVNGSWFWSIHIRTSTDGIHFGSKGNSLFTVGNMGDFDEHGHADPTVSYDGNGNWQMWGDAINGNDKWVGFFRATSQDGLTWSKDTVNSPILALGPTGTWDDVWIHHPVVIKDNNIYYMFYAGNNKSNKLAGIGLATSTDGITWTKEPSNPVIKAYVKTDWDGCYQLIRPSAPIKINGVWHMYYWDWGPTSACSEPSKMGLATSTDLITWTKQGLFMQGSGNGYWDGGQIQSSKAIWDGDIIKMWYTAKSASDSGISLGLAYITDTWTLNIPFSGSGSGATTSDIIPQGVTCGSYCSYDYMDSTMITLSAIPDNNSIFTGWTGDSDCYDGIVSAYLDKTCIANFAHICPDPPGPPVKIKDIANSYYSAIQDAYDVALDDDTIEIKDIQFTGDLYFDQNKSLILDGGYDCVFFKLDMGKTILNGSIMITDGVVTMGNLELR